MPNVPGLRSPYARVGRLVYFGRMLDKIRLQAAGRLPADYQANLGDGNPRFLDGRCCRFLNIPYDAVCTHALARDDDAGVLTSIETRGAPRTDEECENWNGFMLKLGWRDEASQRLQRRIHESGLAGRPIETFFDLIDFDEGRDPVAGRAWELRDSIAIVLIGVAGCGKTTIGLRLAAALGWSYRDADEFHPPENIAKMSRGVPLDDRDRAPWLAAIRAWVDRALARGENIIVSCSALKESYRRALVSTPGRVKFVHLAGDYALILERLRQRQGHFMKPELLRSQFEALEVPQDALPIDIAPPPETIVAEIRRSLAV